MVELVKVRAKQKLNLGLDENKKLLYFEEGEEKVVKLSSLIQRFIEAGALELVDGDEKEVENIDKLEQFTKLKGIGVELAQMLLDKYGDFETFKKKVTKKDLIKLPGIGKERAEEIYKEIKRN